MANVQQYFEQFHDTIRTDYEMNSTLREKKDIILQLLRKRLQEAGRPGFDVLLQGSYSTPIRMGVRPIAALQFDIDIGLRFACDDTEYSASEIRKWIYEGVIAPFPKMRWLKSTFPDILLRSRSLILQVNQRLQTIDAPGEVSEIGR
jgi:hypothetical protein